jgi:hypothetical protein
MSALFDRTIRHRSLGAFVAIVAIALLAVVAMGAVQPRVDNPHGKFKENCQLCHTAKGWKDVKVSPKFDHGKYGFPLTGAHATANCMGCHSSLEFSQSKMLCANCHQDPHRGEMGTDCAHCHAARSFQDRGPMVRAHQLTRFPLTASHATLDCESCHKPAAQGQLQFVGTSADCYSCHKAQYETAPNHKSGHFSTNCAQCHTPVSWSNVGFDHNAAGFPLTGNHSTSVRACDDCHHGNYATTSADCYSCHANSTPGYSNATPAHNPTGFPTNTQSCIGCHAQANATHLSWAGANNYDHTAAGFPLNGNHSLNVRQCDDCHKGNYTTVTKACETCHLNSTPGYANTGAGNPVHNTTYFPYAQCTTCHTSAAASFTSWAGGTYTHTQMQMTNAHAGRACEDCHKGNYSTVAYSCYGCHQNANGGSPGYVTATSPVHTPTYFPTANSNCTGCHNTTAWSPSLWPANHSTTAFAANYTGAHPTLACTQCHSSATWATQATGSNCYGCHSADYAAAQPPHDPTNYPQAGCACHNTTSWANATAFDHASVGFPTTGQHSLAVRQCADCHNTIGYTAKATDKDCITCHLNSNPGYNNTGVGNPVHNQTYFPTTTSQCTTCHASAAASFVSWSGGTYTHSQMQLTNAHAGRACNDCHNGNYTTVAYSCYGCHQNPIGGAPGYATATNPTHTPTYFPTANTNCTGCHSTTAWSPSLWPMNHSTTAFAAYYNGAHPAVLCTDCHNTSTWATKATSNNCYGCHSADYASAQPPHDPTNYPQAGCACHNTTTWANATAFDHSSVGFSTTGQHSLAVRACADCHGIIGYTAKSTDKDCITCHASDYNANGVLIHTSPNFPSTTTQCITCHAAANTNHVTWQGGTFANHTTVTTNFSITNANHGGFLCSDCHTAPTTDLKQYTCSVSCHNGDSRFTGHSNQSCAGTTFNTAKATGTIKACYSCHPRGTSSAAC